MRGEFEIPSEGKFFIGTYTLRKLTKVYNCTPNELFAKAGDGIESLGFTVLLLKYSKENSIIQANGQNNIEEFSETQAEFILDKIANDEKITRVIMDALCQSITGKTLNELEEAGRNATPQEPEQQDAEEKKITSSTGDGLKKLHGEKG